MPERATFRVKRGLAEMLKGGVIMDVTTAEQARIAEDAGAVSVMALERVPADIRAEVIASPRQDSITRLSRVDEDSLVIAFSAGKAHPIVMRAMKLARHRRARTLAITDATLSEVGEHTELALYYSSNSPSFTRSNTALLALVQALAYGVYARDKGAYKDRIRAFKLK